MPSGLEKRSRMNVLDYVTYPILLFRFRRYYRYILTFRFLKSSQSAAEGDSNSRAMPPGGATRETSFAGASK